MLSRIRIAFFSELKLENSSRKIAKRVMGTTTASRLLASCCRRNWAAPGHEVARRQRHPLFQRLPGLLDEGADIPVGDVALDGDETLALLPGDLARSDHLFDPGELNEGYADAHGGLDQDPGDGLGAAAELRGEAHEDVEAGELLRTPAPPPRRRRAA